MHACNSTYMEDKWRILGPVQLGQKPQDPI
jgi:hypothetical protein